MLWETLGYIASRIVLLLIIYLALMLAVLYGLSGKKETAEPSRIEQYLQEYDIRTYRI